MEVDASARRRVRAPKKGEGRKYKHMTSKQKGEAIALWKSGNITIAELSKKYQKNPTTIIRLLKDAGVKKGESSAALHKKIEEKMEEKMVGETALLADRIRTTKEEHYKMNSALAKAAWQTLAKAKAEGRSYGTVATDMRALKQAAELLKITREERYAVLGITTKDDDMDKPLPELKVTLIDDETIRKLQQAAVDFNEDELDMMVEESLPSLDSEDEAVS